MRYAAASALIATAAIHAGEGDAPPPGKLEILAQNAVIFEGDAIPLTWRFTNSLTTPLEVDWNAGGPSALELSFAEAGRPDQPMIPVAEADADAGGSGPGSPNPVIPPGGSFTGRFFLNRFFSAIPAGKHHLAWHQGLACFQAVAGLHEEAFFGGELLAEVRAGANQDAKRITRELYGAFRNAGVNSPPNAECVTWICCMGSPEIIPYLKLMGEAGFPASFQAPVEALYRLRESPEAENLLDGVLGSGNAISSMPPCGTC